MYAIDREALIDAAMLGEGILTGPIPPSLSYWALDLDEVPFYKHDPERARQLLQQAGYGEGFSVDLLFISGRPMYLAMGQAIQSQLAEVGIDVNLKSLEYGIYVDRWLDADLDMAMSQNSGLPDPDFYLFRYFHSEGALTFIHGCWSNARLDSLLEQGRAETNLAKRQALYKEAQYILIEEVPFIWLFVTYEYFAARETVKGFTPLPTGGIDYLKDVWIEQ
jgi:peptide/nickel transport system substrate-binding protein